MFKPKHTVSSVAKYLEQGLRDGSIILGKDEVHLKEDLAVSEETHIEILMNAIKSLPTEYARVLTAYYFKGYSTKKIADELHIPISIVAVRGRRGMSMLKKRLLQETDEYRTIRIKRRDDLDKCAYQLGLPQRDCPD